MRKWVISARIEIIHFLMGMRKGVTSVLTLFLIPGLEPRSFGFFVQKLCHDTLIIEAHLIYFLLFFQQFFLEFVKFQ